MDYGHLELISPQQKQEFQRRSPMFTIKKIEPMKTPGCPDHEEMVLLRKEEMRNRLRNAMKAGLIFSQHEKTSVKARKVSDSAGRTYNRMSVEIDSCRDSVRSFFDARRSIAEAANKIAIEHNIDLQMMDEDDSDEERTNFYEGKTSTQESTSAAESAYYSTSHNSSMTPRREISIKPWNEPNDKPMLKASRGRNKVQLSLQHEPPRRFYNSVNKNFITTKSSPDASIELKTKSIKKELIISHYSSKN